MSELDVADLPGTGHVDTVLVAVAPPDGPAIAGTLRDRGFAVVEAPLPHLGARALPETPQVMIVDLDPPGALEALERAREAMPGAELLCVGEAVRAADLGMSVAGGRVFERPVDLEALVLGVVALAEPAFGPASLPTSYGHVTSAAHPAPKTQPPSRLGDSEAPPVSAYPSTSDPLDLAAILPTFEDAEAAGVAVSFEVSPELRQILEAAEQRTSAVARGHSSSIPSPGEDVDILLPADLLSLLDEPLDPEEEGGVGTGGSGASQGSGASLAATTGARTPTSPPPPTVAGTMLERMTGAETAARTAPPPAPPPSYAPPPRALSVPSAPSAPPPPAAPAALDPQAPPESLPLPAVLGEGDAVRALALAIAARASGALALGTEAAARRIVLHDGDVVTAASTAPDETLLAFLAARGDLDRAEAARLSGKLPGSGRHAGAALIAHGHLGQDDLWPVLRAHAEWIIGRAIVSDEGACALESEPPGRLKAEPNVFGGATGAEVMLEAIRRVIPPETARLRLGGAGARLVAGPRRQLLAECALRPEDEQAVRAAEGRTVGEILAGAEPELGDVLYGLVALGVLEGLAPPRGAEPAAAPHDPLDEEALRQRVRARVAVVLDGDYFAVLGIPRSATGYEIRRAYVELRRSFEPARLLTAGTADLLSDVRLVLEVLDEAYEILREPHRRERYRRAIEAGPPGMA